MKHHLLPVSPKTMHWGYFSKVVAPALTLRSGDRATIETLTHHANDDYERMIKDDPGAESVFQWTREHKAMARRGSGPTEGPFIRGAGEGIGVHLLTGPVAIEGAEPGDVLEVRILDIRPRPSCNACHAGKCFGSNVAANWGFHYHDLIEEPKPREVVTIFELDTQGEPFAKAVYNYVWTPQTDPDGIVHPTIDYPGVRVDHATITRRENIMRGIKVPARLHFGTMGLAPVGSRFRLLDSAELYRRQYRRLAHRQGRADVLSGRGARRVFLGRRSPCRARRQRARRHRDRDLADRRVRVHPAQEERSRRHGARRPDPSDAGDRPGLVGLRLYLSELSRRTRRQCADRDCQPFQPRPRHARRVPQTAAVPDDGAST